jgi:hypothetical protein
MHRPRCYRPVRRHRHQAVRLRTRSRIRGYRAIDAAILILIGLSLLYLARPAWASELPVERGVPGQPSLTRAASVDPLATTPTTGEPAESNLSAARPAAVLVSGTAATPTRAPDLYALAARRYGLSPRLLWALHAVESDLAGDGCLANLEGSGAVGPFQFKPATFRAYALDADGDGRSDICGFADSLFSAARYLKALGADDDPASPATQRALARYGTDPLLVARLALQ